MTTAKSNLTNVLSSHRLRLDKQTKQIESLHTNYTGLQLSFKTLIVTKYFNQDVTIQTTIATKAASGIMIQLLIYTRSRSCQLVRMSQCITASKCLLARNKQSNNPQWLLQLPLCIPTDTVNTT